MSSVTCARQGNLRRDYDTCRVERTIDWGQDGRRISYGTKNTCLNPAFFLKNWTERNNTYHVTMQLQFDNTLLNSSEVRIDGGQSLIAIDWKGQVSTSEIKTRRSESYRWRDQLHHGGGSDIFVQMKGPVAAWRGQWHFCTDEGTSNYDELTPNKDHLNGWEERHAVQKLLTKERSCSPQQRSHDHRRYVRWKLGVRCLKTKTLKLLRFTSVELILCEMLKNSLKGETTVNNWIFENK